MYILAKTSIILGCALFAASAGANIPKSDMVSSKMLKVIERETPIYPPYANKTGREGYAVVEFTVAPDGKVVEPMISETSAGAFGRAALEAIEAWQFEPVYDNGVAVPVRTNLKFSFVPRTE